jgi:uncharacterized protein YqgQ
MMQIKVKEQWMTHIIVKEQWMTHYSNGTMNDAN